MPLPPLCSSPLHPFLPDVNFNTLAIADNDDAAINTAGDSHVKRTRTYDISIQYDTHYSVRFSEFRVVSFV